MENIQQHHHTGDVLDGLKLLSSRPTMYFSCQQNVEGAPSERHRRLEATKPAQVW